MPKRVLVGLDGSPLAESVLPYVGSLAKGLQGEVTLFQVIDVPEVFADEETGHIALEAMVPPEAQLPHLRSHAATLSQAVDREQTIAKDYLARVRKQLQTEGLNVNIAVSVGNAAKEMVRYAEHHAIDIIALATHGRSGPSRWAYGSVAEDVLHLARVPVLLIRPTGSDASRAEALRRILAPLDGSPLAEAALPLAEEMARQLQVPVTLLRAVDPLSLGMSGGYGAWPGNAYQQVIDAVIQSAQDYLAAQADRLRRQGLDVDIRAPFDGAVSAIEADVQQHPGTLVVMATHGRTGIVGAVLGSVARRVVRQLGSPVLVVRPPGARP